MSIAIYEDIFTGRYHFADPDSATTAARLAAGLWVLFDDTPTTPPPNTDPLGVAMTERIAPDRPFGAALRLAAVEAVEEAAAVEPTGAWDFTAATVTGVAGGGGGGGVTDHGALTGLADDDHTQYALADGSRGAFAKAADITAASTADRDRANHTGTQPASTITGLTKASVGLSSVDNTADTAKPVSTAQATAISDASAADRARANHTGTQPAASISDLTEVVQDIVGAFLVAGTNTTVTYDDVANTFTINATGGGGTTDPEIVRDTIGGALVAGAGIQITVNDAGDTITVASTAVLPTRQVIAGTGLSGGGDMSADRTLSVAYGTTAGTAAQGNDARLSDARTPLAHSHTASQISDASTVGRSVLTATDGPTARAAIGAGTSSLALGTAAGTAAEGNDSRIVGAAQRTATKTTVTGAYTLVAGDATDKVLHSTAASALTITLPQDSAASIAQEVAIPWRQYGAGQITFAAGTGATLISRGSVFKSAGQYAEGLLTKVAANTWLLSGDIVA